MTEQRIRFRDVKPYDVVESLADLRGPVHGQITLPTRVFWSGTRRSFDLDVWWQRKQAYQAVLSNGTIDALVEHLNAQRLVEDWPSLALDARLVELWSAKHPELAARRRVA